MKGKQRVPMREAVGSRASGQTLDEIIFSFICRLCLYYAVVSYRLFAFLVFVRWEHY